MTAFDEDSEKFGVAAEVTVKIRLVLWKIDPLRPVIMIA